MPNWRSRWTPSWRDNRFGGAFVDDYLLPMIGCIWSCSTVQMLRFPVGTLIRFCHNHGLLQVRERPQWFTVTGGSRQYVDKIASRIGQVRLARRCWRSRATCRATPASAPRTAGACRCARTRASSGSTRW